MNKVKELVDGSQELMLEETIDNDSLYNVKNVRPVVAITNAQMAKAYIDKGIYRDGDFGFNLENLTFYKCNGYGWVPIGKLAIKDIPTITSTLSPSSTNEEGIGAKVVYDQLQLKENVANKSTTLNASSTDMQYPTSKTVYDYVSTGLAQLNNYALKSSVEIRRV